MLIEPEGRLQKRRPASQRLFPLPEEANPTELDDLLSYEEVERERHLLCKHYIRCLRYAAGLDWNSFSCTMCTLFPLREGEEDPHAS